VIDEHWSKFVRGHVVGQRGGNVRQSLHGAVKGCLG
jgi:hypothetical protein